MAKKYILWSGGFDSTLCLYKLCKGSSENNPVVAITINHSGLHKVQFEAEKLARKKILKELRKRGYFIEELSLSLDSSGRTFSRGWAQQLWWASISANFIDDGDELYFGYISKDEYWRHQTDYESIINSTCKIQRKKVEIKYPLHDYWKYQIVDKLISAKLDKLVWTCDEPIKVGRGFKECDNCCKCIEKKTAYYELDLHNKAGDLWYNEAPEKAR